MQNNSLGYHSNEWSDYTKLMRLFICYSAFIHIDVVICFVCLCVHVSVINSIHQFDEWNKRTIHTHSTHHFAKKSKPLGSCRKTIVMCHWSAIRSASFHRWDALEDEMWNVDYTFDVNPFALFCYANNNILWWRISTTFMCAPQLKFMWS